MRWVVGPAGVGKSAIMQMVAEDTPADASVFLSVDGRYDGTKVFTTIAYQLAAKCEPYRQFVQNEIIRDPSLFRKQVPVQFDKFIVQPFIQWNLFNPPRRFVIIIDGLDECDDPVTQQELLELISEFCISHPISPIVWFVASRPEPHITSFFDDAKVAPAYAKEEIVVDSDEACKDVQRYLHTELNKVKLAYPSLKRKREWPSELEFTKIATAAGGLFAYASTVVRYINDPHFGDPTSRLDDVLVVINASPKDNTSTINDPLALLNALYDRILSKIPDSVRINTRKLLLIRFDRPPRLGFRFQSNRLGLTENAAYGAVRHLHAVVKVPEPDKADHEGLTFFHKSFYDFLLQRFWRGNGDEAQLLDALPSLRIIEQAPANFDRLTCGENIQCGYYGYLKAGPSSCDNISLSWPGDERSSTADHDLRRQLYSISMEIICSEFGRLNKIFSTLPCFNAVTTRFAILDSMFPIDIVRDSVFVSTSGRCPVYDAKTVH
jgi:hypothetical protein